MPEVVGSDLSLKLFGPFEARWQGQLLSGLQVRDGERLLALLILNHGFLVQSTALASTLWPETGSLDSLHHSVNHLRKVLGPEAERLHSSKGGVRLDLDGVEVDLLAFDAAVERGDSAALQEAVALYRGPLLHGWEERWPEDRVWAQRVREKRRDRHREALKTLARSALASGDYERACGYLQSYVAGNPTEEWAWSAWMQALAESGERIAAMSLYLKCRDLFHQKYQLTPPGEMSRLYQQIKQNLPPPPDALPEDQAVLEPVGGAVPLHSPYYIVRPVDAAFQAALARRDSIVLVKGPRQTGKTSLLARGLHQAREAGAAVILTDFQRFSSAHWASAETFFLALAQNVADWLDLEPDPQDLWNPRRGANENLDRYLRRHVLKRVPAPVVWGLDEVDRLFAPSFCNDIFGLFRSWHNERALEPSGPWSRLTLAISYATEAHLFITDLNQSPFNIGTRLALEDFTFEQVAELNALYGHPLEEPEPLARFFGFVGGNPYLVRRGLHEIVTRHLDLVAFEAQADQEGGCYGDHLQRMKAALSQDTGLCQAVRDLLHRKPCPTPESFYRLHSAGLVVGTGPEDAQLRCRLYTHYLGAHLP